MAYTTPETQRPQPPYNVIPVETPPSFQVWQRLREEAAAVTAPKQTVGSSADATPTGAGFAAAAVPPLLPAPIKLPGFTYVSVFLETLSVASTAGMTEPSLSLSVFSAKGQLVEAAQVGLPS